MHTPQCPFCKGTLEGIVSCQKCMTVQHKECFDLVGKCGAMYCDGALADLNSGESLPAKAGDEANVPALPSDAILRIQQAIDRTKNIGITPSRGPNIRYLIEIRPICQDEVSINALIFNTLMKTEGEKNALRVILGYLHYGSLPPQKPEPYSYSLYSLDATQYFGPIHPVNDLVLARLYAAYAHSFPEGEKTLFDVIPKEAARMKNGYRSVIKDLICVGRIPDAMRIACESEDSNLINIVEHVAVNNGSASQLTEVSDILYNRGHYRLSLECESNNPKTTDGRLWKRFKLAKEGLNVAELCEMYYSVYCSLNAKYIFPEPGILREFMWGRDVGGQKIRDFYMKKANSLYNEAVCFLENSNPLKAIELAKLFDDMARVRTIEARIGMLMAASSEIESNR